MKPERCYLRKNSQRSSGAPIDQLQGQNVGPAISPSLFQEKTGYTSVIMGCTSWDVDRNGVELEREKKSILVVDDDKAILACAKAILKAEGYSVDTVETGREAIGKSDARHYDLALLDIKLPDMEGTDLLMKMRRTTPRMRKVVITGHPSIENAVRSLRLGADDYVIKPIDPKTLLKIIKKKLEEQETEGLCLQAVERTLETLLGLGASHVIFDHLGKTCKISKEVIPAKMYEFRIELQKLMGKKVSKIIVQEIESSCKTIVSIETEKPASP